MFVNSEVRNGHMIVHTKRNVFVSVSKCILLAVFLHTNLTFPSANDIDPSENTPAEKTERKTQDGRTPLSEASLQKELKKHREADKDGTQTIIVSEKAANLFRM